MTAPEPGAIYECPYPFVRKPYETGPYDENDAPVIELTWTPGVRFINCGPDDTEAVHDGIGARIATVVSFHKPGRYPTRVFYTVQWRDPAGRAFGKPKLRMATVEKFCRQARGYAHESRQATAEDPTE